MELLQHNSFKFKGCDVGIVAWFFEARRDKTIELDQNEKMDIDPGHEDAYYREVELLWNALRNLPTSC